MRAILLGALFLTAVSAKTAKQPSEKGLKGFGCDFCMMLVEAVEHEIDGGHTEAEILAFMEQVSCNHKRIVAYF